MRICHDGNVVLQDGREEDVGSTYDFISGFQEGDEGRWEVSSQPDETAGGEQFYYDDDGGDVDENTFGAADVAALIDDGGSVVSGLTGGQFRFALQFFPCLLHAPPPHPFQRAAVRSSAGPSVASPGECSCWRYSLLSACSGAVRAPR